MRSPNLKAANKRPVACRQFTLLLICLLFSITAPAQNKVAPALPVTFKDALDELVDVSTLPLYLDNTLCAQVSSYDTTGGNDDGFSGKYSYLRRNADSTLVIFDVNGPGIINRIWTPTPSDDSLDFFIDNLTKPAFTIRYRDLFTGAVFPFSPPLCGNQLGGFYCYLPILFQERCRIVFKGKKTQFHQIQYRLFPTGTSVKKFNIILNKEEALALQKLKLRWSEEHASIADFYPGQPILEERKDFQLQPGQTQVVLKAEHGGRIIAMEFEPASLFEGLTKQIDIRITWDNEKVPAILCPAADFFGYAFGKASMKSLLIGTQGDRTYTYFPMPFDKSSTIEFIFRKPDDGTKVLPVTIQSKIMYTTRARNPDKEGKFYSFWNRNKSAKSRHPHVFLQARGKGHLVGTVLQAQGLKAGMTYFFEGDDSTSIDGQFRMHGTGSEDYFNGGWYALPDRWDAAMSLPLSGALDYSLPFCRTGGYRLFLSDKISFAKNMYHSIEHGPTNNFSSVDYTSVSYYYSNTPPEAVSIPANANTKVFVPDTLMLYPQLMHFGIDGEIAIKPAWAYPTGGETFFCTVTQNSSLQIPLNMPPGDYRLYLDDVMSPESCSFSIWQRQTQVSDWVDRYQAVKQRKENNYLCDVHLDALINSITIRFRANPVRNQFIFNRLVLIRRNP